jgi:hypothetical protein
MQALLLAEVRRRVASGEFTERGLAADIGVSQPHLHNVLKGARALTPGVADPLLARLKLSLRDLLIAPEEAGGLRQVPELAGLLGPGLPFPDADHPLLRHTFAASLLANLRDPKVARLAADNALPPEFLPGDLVLLDFDPRPRARPRAECWYAADFSCGPAVRRARLEGGELYLDSAPVSPVTCISMANKHMLDVLRARIVWLGRQMERLETPARPAEEAGRPSGPAD